MNCVKKQTNCYFLLAFVDAVRLMGDWLAPHDFNPRGGCAVAGFVAGTCIGGVALCHDHTGTRISGF